MNIGELTAWRQKVLNLLRVARAGRLSGSKRKDFSAELLPTTRPMAITFRAKLLEHVRQESSQIPPGERRLGSTEVLESLFGKGKRLEGQQSRSGLTRYVLGLAASVVELTPDTIREALSTVSIKQLQHGQHSTSATPYSQNDEETSRTQSRNKNRINTLDCQSTVLNSPPHTSINNPGGCCAGCCNKRICPPFREPLTIPNSLRYHISHKSDRLYAPCHESVG